VIKPSASPRDPSIRPLPAQPAAAVAARSDAQFGTPEAELVLQRHRMQALMRAGKAIHAVHGSDELLQLVIELAVHATGAERGFIMISDPLGGTHGGTADVRLRPRAWSDPEFAASRTILERALREGEPIQATIDGATSVLCAPLRGKDEVVGAIYVDAAIGNDASPPLDAQLLSAIADQAAAAIVNARLYEDLSRSFRDLSAMKAHNDELLESIASGVLVFDSQNVITQFNHAAEITFGLSASTVVGRGARILNTWLPGFTALLEQHRADASTPLQVEIPGNHFVRGPFILQVTFFRVRGTVTRSGSTAAVINDLTETRALEAENQAQLAKSARIAHSFERYLAPHVVDSLMKDPDSVALGGTRQVATMLFADIRGFTQLSELLLPEQVVELLNRYLAPVVNVIFANGGLLDKFYGDGVMAVFGAPKPGEDDALRAAQAATQILEQVRLLNAAAGVVWPLSVSIGLATGDVVAGHIGSERRLEYTVIGDAVNMASRLQAMAEPNQILADARTYESIEDSLYATSHFSRVRGKAGLTRVYVVHG